LTKLFNFSSQKPTPVPIPMLMDLSKSPDDVIREVFKHMPAKDVVLCSMVCKQWNNVANSQSFWTQKCIYDNYLCDSESIKQVHKIPINILKALVVKRAFNRNFLDDDYSLEKPKLDSRWSDIKRRRQRNYRYSNVFEVQSPPNFFNSTDRQFELDECPEQFLSCLVSSYSRLTRHVYVNLASYGLTPEVLKLLKPTIVVTEYYTNRSDCACVYALKSILLRPDQIVDNGPPESLEGWQATDIRINQWDDEYWRKAEHTWKEYEDNKSIICVSTSGQDGQFWAGNYGVKIAGTSIVVKLEFNNQ